MEIITSALTNFLNMLNWPFIFTLILIAYFVCKLQLPIQIAAVYRVLILGIVLGIVQYYLLGYYLDAPEFKRIHINELMMSYLFATSLYELILSKVLAYFNIK